ncbi:MAG: DNA mismatch repair endonuclease MutL [Bacteroidales bacterium]|nr:DNA mismatch repair endonuclease MutL [Bacteroidales bacterium]
MDIIHLLPDSVANQIAAGEVVQRPASVIKELLENSIDAGATDIHIILREAGRELIQVIDNGKGMSPTDARMAFERHATSKIQQAVDLFALHTMGFRGEALASIVAVAEVEMRTRREEDETGVRLKMAGSKLESQESVACPKGTNLEVRNLFYNVPARRKFLKSNQTELSNIITELQHVALANPNVGFTLVHNDVQMLQLLSGSLKQRITQLFNKGISQQLLPLDVENDLVTIHGFIGQPSAARKKGALQFFFVNDRYMRHPYFHKAVLECYQDLIPEGSQPNYFIYLKVDPASIDVNIHPTKTEIKFENEPARWHILMAAVREALGKFNAVPTIDFDQADAPEITVLPSREESKHMTEPKVHYDPGYNPFRKTQADNWQSLYDDFLTLPSKVSEDQTEPDESEALGGLVPPTAPLSSRMNEELPLTEDKQQDLSPVGHFIQVANRYIATCSHNALLLFDQHRAHIAVLYDRYYQQMCNKQGISQQELFPEIVEIAAADVPVLEKILPELSYLGFELNNLGGGSYAIAGKPASLENQIDFHALLLQMIDAARDEVHGVSDALNRKLALRLAQAQAIRAGKKMCEEEMRQLVESLFDLKEHTYGPDGRLIAVSLSASDIENRF